MTTVPTDIRAWTPRFALAGLTGLRLVATEL
jgi:hypothetical protein